MQANDDPWNWDVERVCREILQATGDHGATESMRANRISGDSLLTIIDRGNLKNEIGIVPLGTRGTIVRYIDLWRQNSPRYKDYVARKDQQRFREKLKSLVHEHQLQHQFHQLIGSGQGDFIRDLDLPELDFQPNLDSQRGDVREWGDRENLRTVQEGKSAQHRSVSPLPDLGTIGLEESVVTNVERSLFHPDLNSYFALFTIPGAAPRFVPHVQPDNPKGPTMPNGQQHMGQLDALQVSASIMDIDEPSQVALSGAPIHGQQTCQLPDGPLTVIARRPSENSRRKNRGGYLGPQAFLVDDLFYGGRDFDVEEDDNFLVQPSDAPVGVKRYVERQIRHFLVNPEVSLTIKRDRLYRKAIKPYRASLVKKHYIQSMTVFDACGGKFNVFQAKVDDEDMSDLVWDKTNGFPNKDDGQRMTFGEDPLAPAKINYNKDDKSEHCYDYLLKWLKVDGDKTLPPFGDSESEGEYDIATWREIEEEIGEGHGGVSSKTPSVVLASGGRPVKAEQIRRTDRLRMGAEREGEEGLSGDTDLEGASVNQPELETDPGRVRDGSMDLDRSPSPSKHNIGKTSHINCSHEAKELLNVIDLTMDMSEDETQPVVKKKRLSERRQSYRERRRTKFFPEEEDDLVFSVRSSEEEISSRQCRKQVETPENLSAKASREDVHRLVKARARRIALETSRRKEGAAPELEGKVEINVGKYAKHDYICIHPQIAEHLKQHQVRGIRFLWAELVQSNRNVGALLAHTMGLGKTFQVIAFLHTIAAAGASNVPRVRDQIPSHLRESRSLVICPAGLVDNWWDEFHQWLPMNKDTGTLDLTHIGSIHKIDSTTSFDMRVHIIKAWYEKGGVLILSYHMLRGLVNDEKEEALRRANVKKMLLEGPNIIVADEAHQMKNPKSEITKVANQFTSRSRIALTGSPLANNLSEYWTIVEWIDPGYLGPEKEFDQHYAKVIYNGMYVNSTKEQKRQSLKMLHVLKKDLEPKVERADITAIQSYLPAKTEFLITVPLTAVQKELYSLLLEDIKKKQYSYLDSVHLLSLVNNHPKAVLMTLEKRDAYKKKANELNYREEAGALTESFDTIVPTLNSAKSLLEKFDDISHRRYSNRMEALRLILKASQNIHDKVLVFSHSIPTLDLLEKNMRRWQLKYQRLDGATDASTRQQTTKDFNAGSVYDVFLISTKAGGLGLNLFGANRVIIFDFRWAPMWEQQAVGRAYRIGQTKPVFVYRFIAGGTFEDRVRNMTEFKNQLQIRVVDKKDPLRQSSELGTYILSPPTEPVQQNLSEFKGKDGVLDDLLTKVNYVRAITYTQTFIPDEEDALDEQEKAEADSLLQQRQRLRLGGESSKTVSLSYRTESLQQPQTESSGMAVWGHEGEEDVSALRIRIQQSAQAVNTPSAKSAKSSTSASTSLYTPFSKKQQTFAPSIPRTALQSTPVAGKVNNSSPSSAPPKLPSTILSTSSRIPFQYDEDEGSTSGEDEQGNSGNRIADEMEIDHDERRSKVLYSEIV